VIDGSGGTPIDNATIVIRDERIVAIGSSAATPVPSGAEAVDYTGKTIIPGLISDHSHVSSLASRLHRRTTIVMPSCGS
jgi:imidazolonepropionase-like amidohydrolase